MVDETVEAVEDSGQKITCEAGCDHCCHLLIEVSWEEAQELAYAVHELPDERKDFYKKRIKDNADEARSFFASRKSVADFASPVADSDREIDDEVYDDYFYEKKRPCPFLIDSMCSLYESRPTSCRLHMVASDPYLCSADCRDDDDYDIPDEVEELKENASHPISAVEKDGRWGHFGILVDEALSELESRGALSDLQAEQIAS